MKKILITGAKSYLGTSLENYLKQWPEKYLIKVIDMRDGSWEKTSFVGYDTIYHVAGIAHSDTNLVNQQIGDKYYKINTDLAINTAKKAKSEGIKQFIFMSSVIIYGNVAPIGKSKIITKETEPKPANAYGDSKLRAEKGIMSLVDEKFKVLILRAPMIYGKCSKGNYPVLSRISLKLDVFPYIKNQRSMLYIGNLVEFLRLMIENQESGIFWPQNSEYSNTSELVKTIAEAHGKKIKFIKGFTWLVKLVSVFSGYVNKAFGNLVYDMSISEYKENYRKYSLYESIMLTEK